MTRKAEMKQKLVEQRDRILAEIEALRNKVKGLEMAIALVDGEGVANSEDAGKSRRSGMKGIVLDLLSEAGTTGLNAVMAVEVANRRGVSLDRQSVSSLLSRLKKEGTLVYEGDRYKLRQFAADRALDVQPLRVVHPS